MVEPAATELSPLVLFTDNSAAGVTVSVAVAPAALLPQVVCSAPTARVLV